MPTADTDARIVSLVPSLTETLFDLRLSERLVGRTHYCIHPGGLVDGVPSVGGTKKIRMDRLLALRPTHVLVNVDETPKALADAIVAAGIEIVVIHPIEPEDNLAYFRTVGSIFGRSDEAERLCQSFNAALQDLTTATAAASDQRVLYLIWKDPWMTVSADTYIARMLALIRWQTLGHDPQRRYPEIDLGACACQADRVLFSSEPYRFKDTHVAAFRDAFPDTPAYLVDGEMLSWYGSRAIRGLRYLGRLLRETRA